MQEIKTLAQEKWWAAVWLHLPEGKPINHPDVEPLWATMNDLDLPLIHHSFFVEPPYFPGYGDIWGNAAVARTAAHPWGAARRRRLTASHAAVGRGCRGYRPQTG